MKRLLGSVVLKLSSASRDLPMLTTCPFSRRALFIGRERKGNSPGFLPPLAAHSFLGLWYLTCGVVVSVVLYLYPYLPLIFIYSSTIVEAFTDTNICTYGILFAKNKRIFVLNVQILMVLHFISKH